MEKGPLARATWVALGGRDKVAASRGSGSRGSGSRGSGSRGSGSRGSGSDL